MKGCTGGGVQGEASGVSVFHTIWDKEVTFLSVCLLAIWRKTTNRIYIKNFTRDVLMDKKELIKF